MLSPTFYQHCVLRHQCVVFCFQPHFPASPRRAELKGHEPAAFSADKGTVTLSRPLQPWGPLVAPFNPGHGVWWPCPGSCCMAGRAAGGDAPGSVPGRWVLEGVGMLVLPFGCLPRPTPIPLPRLSTIFLLHAPSSDTWNSSGW